MRACPCKIEHHVCTHTYIHTHMHVPSACLLEFSHVLLTDHLRQLRYAWLPVCMYVLMYACMFCKSCFTLVAYYVHAHEYTSVCMHGYKCAYHIYIHEFTYKAMVRISWCTYTYIHAYIHTSMMSKANLAIFAAWQSSWSTIRFVTAGMYVCVYVCICKSIHTYTARMFLLRGNPLEPLSGS